MLFVRIECRKLSSLDFDAIDVIDTLSRGDLLGLNKKLCLSRWPAKPFWRLPFWKIPNFFRTVSFAFAAFE